MRLSVSEIKASESFSGQIRVFTEGRNGSFVLHSPLISDRVFWGKISHSDFQSPSSQ